MELDMNIPVLWYRGSVVYHARWTHNVIITLLLHQNNVAMPFGCNYEVTITSFVCWDI